MTSTYEFTSAGQGGGSKERGKQGEVAAGGPFVGYAPWSACPFRSVSRVPCPRFKEMFEDHCCVRDGKE